MTAPQLDPFLDWNFAAVEINSWVDSTTRKRLRKEYERIKRSMGLTGEYHHVLPLSLGGTNNPRNWVPIDTRPHQQIHKFIDAQLSHKLLVILVPVKPEWVPNLMSCFPSTPLILKP